MPVDPERSGRIDLNQKISASQWLTVWSGSDEFQFPGDEEHPAQKQLLNRRALPIAARYSVFAHSTTVAAIRASSTNETAQCSSLIPWLTSQRSPSRAAPHG